MVFADLIPALTQGCFGSKKSKKSRSNNKCGTKSRTRGSKKNRGRGGRCGCR